MIHILFIGDIIGKPGREIVSNTLPNLIKENKIDLVIANGENLAGGFGITNKLFHKVRHYGVDIVTSGNHVFDRQEAQAVLDKEEHLIRPLNYPDGTAGRGYVLLTPKRSPDIPKIAVVNIMGRVFMNSIDCPFMAMKRLLQELKTKTRVIIVDFHAEATAEKQAMAWFLDGWVSLVIGTHSHVQTSDERILGRGTGYITDAGMTGAFDSVIGMKKEASIKRFISCLPVRFCIAER